MLVIKLNMRIKALHKKLVTLAPKWGFLLDSCDTLYRKFWLNLAK